MCTKGGEYKYFHSYLNFTIIISTTIILNVKTDNIIRKVLTTQILDQFVSINVDKQKKEEKYSQ